MLRKANATAIGAKARGVRLGSAARTRLQIGRQTQGSATSAVEAPPMFQAMNITFRAGAWDPLRATLATERATLPNGFPWAGMASAEAGS